MRYQALLVIALLVMSVRLSAGESAADITPAQAKKMIEKGNVLVLDVRTPKEYRSGHLANAVLIDFFSKDFLPNVLKLDKRQTVIVYCASGGRSSEATEMMVDNGFKKVYNVLGGFQRWSAESLPSVR